MPPQRKHPPRSPELGALGQAIEALIAEDADMTQESAAHDGDLDVKQVNEFIGGQGNPTYTTLGKLCKGLKVRPGELLTRADKLLEKRSRR